MFLILFSLKVHLVAVAFYNLAVEEEFQRDYDKALEWYKKAYQFIEEKLGPNEVSIKKFKLAYESTKEVKKKEKNYHFYKESDR